MNPMVNTGARGRPRRTISFLATLGLAAGMLAITTSPADAVTCVARDGAASDPNLQSIIDGATTGDVIAISGTCIGNFSIPGSGSATTLTLVGWRAAILDGNSSGSVLSVGSGEIVTIKNLLITNGNTDEFGGGINNSGTVDLGWRTKVYGNTAGFYAGGIFNDGGTVNLSSNAQVNGNTGYYGGGIYSFNGTVTMSGWAQVNDNVSTLYGGGIFNYGTLTMSGRAQVNGNSGYLFGGGILNDDTVTMSGRAQVTGNTAGNIGGGIYNNGNVTMSRFAKVNGNSVDIDVVGAGGGIYNNAGGILVGAVAGVNVKANIPDDIAP